MKKPLVREELRSALRGVMKTDRAAAILGAQNFVIHPGPEQAEQPAGNGRSERLENVARSLREIATRCRALGLRCVVENKLPHLLFGNTADMLWILDAMAAIETGVCLDTGHAHLARELHPAVHQLSRHLRMVHASDHSGHRDDHLPPGRGQIGWPKVVRLLRDHSFRGSLTIHHPRIRGCLPRVDGLEPEISHVT